jgi:hypothetical protein
MLRLARSAPLRTQAVANCRGAAAFPLSRSGVSANLRIEREDQQLDELNSACAPPLDERPVAPACGGDLRSAAQSMRSRNGLCISPRRMFQHPASQDVREVQVSWSAPSSGRDSALSSGLMARDQITCPVQAATKMHEAQHSISIDMHFGAKVKSQGPLQNGPSLRNTVTASLEVLRTRRRGP